MNYLKKLLTPYRGLPREVYVIFISRIVNALGCFVMPLLTLILTEKIGLPQDEAGLYISGSGFVFMFASIIGGKLADTIGRKKLIIIFDALVVLLYIVCGFMEPSISMVYVIMAASACASIAGPAHESMIADITTPENRDGAYALSYMGWNIGFAVGPVLGGILYKNHLPLVFIGDALTAMLSLLLIVIFIKETIGNTKIEITDKSRLLERKEDGSIFKVLLKRPVLIYFALISVGYNFVYSQWSFMMPLHSAQNFGEAGAKYYGLMSGLNGVVVMLCTPFITKLLEEKNVIRKMVYGGILYAFGFGMLGVLNSLPFFFVSVIVFTLGEIVLSISSSPFIANHTPASHRGRMSSVLGMIFGMGYIVSPFCMGKLLKLISIETGWIALGIFAGAATVLMRWLENYDKRKNAEEGNDEIIVA